jgi:hypothetical protein
MAEAEEEPSPQVPDPAGLVMEDGHGWTDEALETIHDLLLHDLESGHGQEENQSWTEGIRYNAQCDGKNHYLYKMDKSAINPKTGHGYSKGRIYAGAFNKNRHKCEAYAASWESRHTCGAGRSGDGHGRVEGSPASGSQNGVGSHPVKPFRWQDFTIPND